MNRRSSRYILLGITLGLGLVLLGVFGVGLRSIKAAAFSPSSTFMVTNTNDSGPGSLREAITDANGNPGADMISITTNGTLLLLSPLPVITDSVTIHGPGADQFAVDGNNSFRVLGIDTDNVTITDITIQHGMVSGGSEHGAGIQATQSLTLEDVDVLSNTAESYGGGLYVTGALTMTEGSVRNNTSTSSIGGGMRTLGTTIISGTQFIGNSSRDDGGGAYVLVELVINNALFQDNCCTGSACDGGALFSFSQTSFHNTQFISNTAIDHGGAVASPGNLKITGSLFRNNRSEFGAGGAVYAQDMVAITDTHFISNTARSNGGGMYAFATADINGVLFENNHSTIGSGGGLNASGDLNLARVRFIRNTAVEGGGLSHSLGSASMVNSLFAENVAINAAGMAILLASTENVEVLHATIAGLADISGSAIEVTAGSAAITNTIITSHTVGISNTGAIVRQDFNLFFGNGTNTQGGVSGGDNSLNGDPNFVAPGEDDYHISLETDANDKGTDVGVTIDFDGDTRPADFGFDIGFDEVKRPTILIYLALVSK